MPASPTRAFRSSTRFRTRCAWNRTWSSSSTRADPPIRPDQRGRPSRSPFLLLGASFMTSPPLPEWTPHEAVWIGFPSDPELWLGDLKDAEREVAAFAEAIHANGKGETVRLVATHDGAADSARRLAPFAEIVIEPFGDIWLRDTGPIVLGSGRNRRA